MSFHLQNICLRNIMSKILITGGAGFIGAHLARILKKNNKIMVVDNLENKGGIPYIDRSNIFIKGNILDNKILKKLKNGNLKLYIILLPSLAAKVLMTIPKKILILMVMGHIY